MVISEQEGKVQVFQAFSKDTAMPFPYPEDNLSPFEEWYSENFQPEDVRDRIYLPVFWTGYYVRANYGKDQHQIDKLQRYLNVLDRTRKYYTIVQYDDGILNNLSGLDIRVYSMSGKPMDYPLPLICPPHNFHFPNLGREFMFSFIGRPTHPVRQTLVRDFGNKSGCYVTHRHHSLEDYCRILARSTFVLCPRGYGPSSFRICEALQYGAIPVYISDVHIVGHYVHFPGIYLDSESETCYSVEKAIDWVNSQGLTAYWQPLLKDCYQKYYTFAANKKRILDDLSNLKT